MDLHQEQALAPEAAQSEPNLVSFLNASQDIYYCGNEKFLQLVVADTDNGNLDAANTVLDIAHAWAGAIHQLDIRAKETGGESVPAYKLAAGLELLVGLARGLVAEAIKERSAAERGG